MNTTDIKAIVAGSIGWTVAIPLVRLVGPRVSSGSNLEKVSVLTLCLGIGIVTTPLLSHILNWHTSNERIRGIALALGTAQCIDGVVNMFIPDFYSPNALHALGGVASIFAAAGTLGIFSVYT